MSKQMSSGVMIALRPVICQDVGLRIQKIIKEEHHKVFRQELLDSVYRFVVRQCDDEINMKIFWEWIQYRELCFPNEIGCSCCDAGYPGVMCKKKWCKHQECICNLENNTDYWSQNNKYCICDSPHRRQYNTPDKCRDCEGHDYEFFQKILLK
jgi:hypothetical protein